MTTGILFTPGNIVITDGATAVLKVADVVSMMRRHLTGDWSEMDADDRAVNLAAARDGGQVLSQYTLANGTRIWVVTEADRTTTTILLPEEY
jgi:hypothetical protein